MDNQFRCTDCGLESVHSFQVCPGCGNWRTCEAHVSVKRETVNTSAINHNPADGAIPSTKVKSVKYPRIIAGPCEVARVLGGGFVIPGLYLFTGLPGAGKSTLCTQICSSLAVGGDVVLYVCGEEKPSQVANRIERVGSTTDKFLLWPFVEMAQIEAEVESKRPKFLVIDSINSVYCEEFGTTPGSVKQMMECTKRFDKLALKYGLPVLIIGHVNKENKAAGPKALEHYVDVYMALEGERSSDIKLLKAYKNRFGSTKELGILRMTADGLISEENTSSLFAIDRDKAISGAVRCVVPFGERALPIEIQCLAVPTERADPKRIYTGVARNRAEQVLACLSYHGKVDVGTYDIIISTVGGFEVDDIGADLAIALVVVSAIYERPLSDLCAIGEISLTGEVYPASGMTERVDSSVGYQLCAPLDSPLLFDIVRRYIKPKN